MKEVPKINFKKSRTSQKYQNKFMKSLTKFCFYKNISGVPNWVQFEPTKKAIHITYLKSAFCLKQNYKMN